MPRIAVVTSSPPLAEGGHLVMARALVQALREAGHETGLVVTPQNRFGRQGAAYLAAWLTDVGMGDGQRVDQVISLRYPAYAVRHPVHVCWLNHTMREYYDQWDRFRAGLSWKGRLKEGTRRRLIHLADGYLLRRHVTRIFAISGTVAERLRRWSGVGATVLYPPVPPRPYRCDGYGDYLFTVSRLTPLKRMDLIVRALAEPAARGIRCLIAGEGDEATPLVRLAAELGLEDRVRLIGRIDDATLVGHLAACRAVCFTPCDEDYGLVAVEAFAARKPVITCADSGGPAELVRDGISGLVSPPEPAALAAAMRRLMDDAGEAERLGTAGYAAAAELTWAETVRRLVV